MLLVIEEVAHIDGAVLVDVHANALALVFLPEPFVDVPLVADESPPPIGLALSPPPNIKRAVGPDLNAFSFLESLLFFHLPLPQVLYSIGKAHQVPHRDLSQPLRLLSEVKLPHFSVNIFDGLLKQVRVLGEQGQEEWRVFQEPLLINLLQDVFALFRQHLLFYLKSISMEVLLSLNIPDSEIVVELFDLFDGEVSDLPLTEQVLLCLLKSYVLKVLREVQAVLVRLIHHHIHLIHERIAGHDRGTVD
eukprot:CAMPEP_0170556254 /NCGR_PEP_ID=MMETSP0211-20121228/15946_1 /TAXON_ID=311385 /ORGANISM="Pseudokeronopsis sp., Strain OXSARD2" /LENGTH=247 /DNA_ID=CAMNT_0010866479 /DNA_START=463 /DNA_END=1206 /DNA_ORIENTATION=-